MVDQVGFVGLGMMGRAMAGRLLDVPGGLTVFDLDPAAAAALVERGAGMASSVAHLAELAQLVCVAVRDDDQVQAVVGDLLAVPPDARAVRTVLVHTTIRPAMAAELARQGDAVGVTVIDAAVTGSPAAAEQGRLGFLCGGTEALVGDLVPVLERMGDLVVHFGSPGAGMAAKLARNIIQFVSFAAAGEAGRLAEAAGLDPALLGEVVRHSDAVSGGPGAALWRDTTAPLASDEPAREPLEHLANLGEHDLGLAVELGGQLGVQTPLTLVAIGWLDRGLGVEPPQA